MPSTLDATSRCGRHTNGQKNTVRPLRKVSHAGIASSQLPQRDLMAHNRVRLVLLHSCPDTVRGRLLHKTLGSTFPECGQTRKSAVLKRLFGPTVADGGSQGTANSPPSTAWVLYTKKAACAIQMPMLILFFRKFDIPSGFPRRVAHR